MNRNMHDIAFQLMADRTRKLEEELEKVKKDARHYERRMKDLELSVGRLSENSQLSADDTTTNKDSGTTYSSSRSSAEHRKRSQSSADKSDTDKTYYSAYSVGTVPWIKQTYGPKAHQIMVKLSDLGIGECKWPMIFDARFSADKLLPQRMLEARFTEADLRRFVMVRHNATKPKNAFGMPLKSTDGSAVGPTKTILPGQKEMIGKLI